MATQLSFLWSPQEDSDTLLCDEFSHDQLNPEDARLALEYRYTRLFEESDEFSRQIVSFQANKTDVLHRWIKYREGFSSVLVDILIRKFDLQRGNAILDPFAGSCTTLLVAKMLGLDAVGIDILPHTRLAWEAKSRAFEYDVNELLYVKQLVISETPPPVSKRFPHLTITESAFPDETERDLLAYTCWFDSLTISPGAKDLCKFILMSILERISYTRKDGQYLRWDERARKVADRNMKRVTQGKSPIKGIDKGPLPTVKQAFLDTLGKIIADVCELQQDPPPPSHQKLISGNTLYVLPEMQANQFAAVITSPPYANRYDYTRTYALELAYMGVASDIFDLRQNQLSCTVENSSKIEQLQQFYESINASERFGRILGAARENKALAEVNAALQDRSKRGEINNTGVLSMVDQYFTELTFVFAELHRVCRSGALVAFVNDNVRYAGEIIPVDTLCTSLAESVGFEPVRIYVLPQRKGNSSQQMGKYGRVALRKSITLWRRA